MSGTEPAASVKTASVKGREPSIKASSPPSVRSAAKESPASIRSVKSKSPSVKSASKASTIIDTANVAPLSAANLSRLDGSSVRTGSVAGSQRGPASVSTYNPAAGVGSPAYSTVLNDYQIPYLKRQVPPSTKVVPSNKELRRHTLMDRYAQMRDPTFDSTYDLGANQQQKEEKKKMEIAVVNPLIAARQAKSDGHGKPFSTANLDQDSKEALSLVHSGQTPDEILAAAEKHAAWKEVDRKRRAAEEAKLAEERRKKEAEEAEERKALDEARKAREKSEKEYRKEQDRINKDRLKTVDKEEKAAFKERQRLEKEERRKSKEAGALAPPSYVVTRDDEDEDEGEHEGLQIGDEVPTRVKSREDESHLTEELPATEKHTLPDPVPDAGPSVDSPEGLENAKAGEEGRLKAATALPPVQPEGNLEYSRIRIDEPKSPKDKEPGLFSKIFRRRSLKKNAGAGAAVGAAVGAGAAAASQSKADENVEEAPSRSYVSQDKQEEETNTGVVTEVDNDGETEVKELPTHEVAEGTPEDPSKGSESLALGSAVGENDATAATTETKEENAQDLPDSISKPPQVHSSDASEGSIQRHEAEILPFYQTDSKFEQPGLLAFYHPKESSNETGTQEPISSAVLNSEITEQQANQAEQANQGQEEEVSRSGKSATVLVGSAALASAVLADKDAQPTSQTESLPPTSEVAISEEASAQPTNSTLPPDQFLQQQRAALQQSLQRDIDTPEMQKNSVDKSEPVDNSTPPANIAATQNYTPDVFITSKPDPEIKQTTDDDLAPNPSPSTEEPHIPPAPSSLHATSETLPPALFIEQEGQSIPPVDAGDTAPQARASTLAPLPSPQTLAPEQFVKQDDVDREPVAIGASLESKEETQLQSQTTNLPHSQSSLYATKETLPPTQFLEQEAPQTSTVTSNDDPSQKTHTTVSAPLLSPQTLSPAQFVQQDGMDAAPVVFGDEKTPEQKTDTAQVQDAPQDESIPEKRKAHVVPAPIVVPVPQAAKAVPSNSSTPQSAQEDNLPTPIALPSSSFADSQAFKNPSERPTNLTKESKKVARTHQGTQTEGLMGAAALGAGAMAVHEHNESAVEDSGEATPLPESQSALQATQETLPPQQFLNQPSVSDPTQDEASFGLENAAKKPVAAPLPSPQTLPPDQFVKQKGVPTVQETKKRPFINRILSRKRKVPKEDKGVQFPINAIAYEFVKV